MINCVLVWFLKPVPLSENDGTLDQQLEACRSMPQHAAASQNFLGDRWCLVAAVSVLFGCGGCAGAAPLVCQMAGMGQGGGVCYFSQF